MSAASPDYLRDSRLPPSKPLPTVEQASNAAWAEGWWQGIPVGLVIGFAVAVVLFKSGAL